MKTLNELSKVEKIDLLKAIRNHEVDPKDLKPTTTVVSDGKDMFMGLMVQSSQVDNKPCDMVYIGQAKLELEKFMSNFKPKSDETNK